MLRRGPSSNANGKARQKNENPATGRAIEAITGTEMRTNEAFGEWVRLCRMALRNKDSWP
jgi:hypothetical protein